MENVLGSIEVGVKDYLAVPTLKSRAVPKQFLPPLKEVGFLAGVRIYV